MNTIIPRTLQFFRAPIGKKFVMAVTGVILFLFLIGHLLGNLQLFLGEQVFNDYAAFLHRTKGLLWGTRIVLLVCVVLHIHASIQLTRLKQEARPSKYVVKNYRAASYAARTMMWSGPIIAAFVVYHLLHFTVGTAYGANFDAENPYANVVNAFKVLPVSIAYIVAMALLGFHLYHGLFSMLASLGANYKLFEPWARRVTMAFAILLTAGFIAIPVTVLAAF